MGSTRTSTKECQPSDSPRTILSRRPGRREQGRQGAEFFLEVTTKESRATLPTTVVSFDSSWVGCSPYCRVLIGIELDAPGPIGNCEIEHLRAPDLTYSESRVVMDSQNSGIASIAMTRNPFRK